MSNEENPEQQHGQPDPYAGWQPTPQGGEYDAEATAFVHLPPEDLADLGNDPLAAPGQGYVPPMILPLTPAAGLDPAATGSWVVRTPEQQGQTAGPSAGPDSAPEAVHWPDPNQQQDPYQQPYPDTSQYAQTSSTTAQWNFTDAHVTDARFTGAVPAEPEPEPEPAPEPAGHTGEWTIPVANGDLPEESGEFASSTMASQWYADAPPATLPGGAPAPWATQERAAEPEPEAAAPAEVPSGPTEPVHAADEPDEPLEAPAAEVPAPAAEAAEPAAGTPDASEASGTATGTETANEGDPAPENGPEHGPDLAPEHGPDLAPGHGPDLAPGHGPGQDLGPADEPGGHPDPQSAIATAPGPSPSEHASTSYALHVNGVDRPVSDAWIGESLLYVLRERLGLAGAKDGCSQGECGACNVQVDGRLVASCLVPAATTAGSEVRTVEGLAVDGEPSDVQRALAECGAVQCGFCIPGMAMTVHDLLEGNHAPSELETRQALCGNLCRCSGYRGVLDAVRDVVESREATADAAAAAPEEAAEPRIPHQAAPGAGSVQAPGPEGDVR
uniref:2Fe-2S iron-sulfur cluster-binding protein n=1 Tax=Streptomyces sp. NBC_01401 TaxID=2903854 RepID=A0AAU3GWJ3_9ACTN